MPRTHEELITQLRTHVTFLRRSGRLFDDGAENEALRLAVSIRVLVHDTRNSVSVLKQLGVKTPMYLDSYIPPPEPREGELIWQMGAGVAALTADESGRPCYAATRISTRCRSDRFRSMNGGTGRSSEIRPAPASRGRLSS